MLTFEGHDCKVYADTIEQTAIDQINQLLSINVFSNCKIRIMPDVHAGAGCVIGFTANLGERIIPNLVGVDIGCAIFCVKLGKIDMDYKSLDDFIRTTIPHGKNVHEDVNKLPSEYMFYYRLGKECISELKCYRELSDAKRLAKSIGTLGGGNHFIEIDKDEEGNLYLLVHTGSRNLGFQVCKIYQKLASKNMSGWDKLMEKQSQIIAEYKAAGRRSELQSVISKLHSEFKMTNPGIPESLRYLEGQSAQDYLHDMKLCQEFASYNRKCIVELINTYLKVDYDVVCHTIHNYISEEGIIRKGAVSANEGETLIIPMNMRDGSLICVGKGNEDWNCSAPHGAGRLMSRAQAFKTLSMDDFSKSMEGINTWSVSESTIDEAPMAYKPIDEIVRLIEPTVSIQKVIKPVYNFKAAE